MYKIIIQIIMLLLACFFFSIVDLWPAEASGAAKRLGQWAVRKSDAGEFHPAEYQHSAGAARHHRQCRLWLDPVHVKGLAQAAAQHYKKMCHSLIITKNRFGVLIEFGYWVGYEKYKTFMMGCYCTIIKQITSPWTIIRLNPFTFLSVFHGTAWFLYMQKWFLI